MSNTFCRVCREPLPVRAHICPLSGLLTPHILDLTAPGWFKDHHNSTRET